jgi:aminoacylase
MESISVTRFRQYLQIKTVQPQPDYESCHPFFKKYAQELELEYETISVVDKKPIFILTWKGSDPSLPSFMLNSHIDVVPVSLKHWTQDPFAATKLPNGDIVARGSQDMKCVGISYLEAIRILKQSNFTPKRTILVT